MHPRVVMSTAAFSFASCEADTAQDSAGGDDVFRGRLVAAMRDLRAREKRASSPELRLGDAANDSVRFPALRSPD